MPRSSSMSSSSDGDLPPSIDLYDRVHSNRPFSCARHMGMTGFSGTRAVSPDGRRKERTHPASAAVRREVIALEPPAVEVLRTL